MKKNSFFIYYGVIIFLPIILVSGYLIFFCSLRNNTSLVNAESSCALISDGTGTMPIANTTFIKSYRLLVFTKINGVWPTRDGGYIVSGTTDPNIMFIPPDGFVAKLDKEGNISWLKMLKTTNASGAGNPLGDEDVQSIIELKNGGYLMASKVWGFITSKEWSSDAEVNKILLTKLDKNGNALWSKSFTGFVESAKNSLLETPDKGFLFYANILDLAPNERGEDSDVYQDLPFASLKVLKFDQNGTLQWSKNIKNFISRENDSYLIPTQDGGYDLVGNMTEPNAEKSGPYDFDTYPGMAKFDKNFKFEWAKSLEGTPLEMAVAIPKPEGGYELGWKKVRQGASVIRGVVQTQDGGYIVLGQLSGAGSLITDANGIKSGAVNSSLVGFKFSSSGSLDWVKKITFGFNEFTVSLINFSLTPTIDNKIMLVGPITWAEDDYRDKTQSVNDMVKWYTEKYGKVEMAKQDSEKTKESQEDWKKVQEVITDTQDSFRAGIFMMKMDQTLNATWAGIINPHRGTINNVVKATTDSGAIIAGEYETSVVQSVLYGSITYYKDGFLLKLDASGNVKDEADWLTGYNKQIVTEMMTPYAVSNDLIANVVSYSVNLTSRNPEFSLYKKAKTTSYAPFISAKTTQCPVSPSVTTYDNPLQNSNETSSANKTWPEINYEKEVPVETINEKSSTIHSELLPILNQLYHNHVKLVDNMGGTMLSYVFDRVITADDIITVKNHLESLDYKTQDDGGNQMTMYKPGYFLVMTFSLNNKSKAFLDVTY